MRISGQEVLALITQLGKLNVRRCIRKLSTVASKQANLAIGAIRVNTSKSTYKLVDCRVESTKNVHQNYLNTF